jgi:1-acyl-sn-glycerol-3-phosphate acyltransferase
MALGENLQHLTEWVRDRVAPEVTAAYGFMRRSVDDFAEQVLGGDFEQRVELLRQRYQRPGGDPFGLDPDTAERVIKLCAFLHRRYFRTEVRGIEHFPEGRALLVANHSGQVPLDAAIIAAAAFLDANPPRVVRAMVEKWAQTLPFVSTLFTRVGQVVGVPENARRLLATGEAVLSFPEGIRGISKPFSERYQLQPFGKGFMRLAMATEAPIVPVALVGAEEQYISLGNLELLAEMLGMPVFPLIPQVLLPLGQLPLPTKYHLEFGEPRVFAGNPEDDELVTECVERVRQTIRTMLDRCLGERRGVFF